MATTEDEYLEIIKSKTSHLFSTASKINSYLIECSDEHKNSLDSFGMNLGTAFQLIDDLLDYKATENDFGKMTGDDFKEGKMTLPIILALRRSNKIENNFWRKTIQDGQIKSRRLSKSVLNIKKKKNYR